MDLARAARRKIPLSDALDGRGGATSLDSAREDVGLSRADLWMRYFALGGNAMPTEFEAYLEGVLEPGPVEYDIVVHAINERSMEMGLDRRWPYSGS